MPAARKAVVGVTIVAFAVPVAAYLWLIQHYAVNAVYLDQWSDVRLVQRTYTHSLGIGDLWAQHSEQRMLFPNLFVLALARVDHLNIVVEEYVSASMLVGAVALIVVAHRRHFPTLPWIAYLPVAVVMLSLVQAQSTLFGFQFAWYAVILSLAAALYFLDGPSLSLPTFFAALVVGLVGSLSCEQGLLIWPCGLLVLYQRRRPTKFLCTWVAVAAATVLAYTYHYQVSRGVPPGLSGTDIPTYAVHSFFWVIGGVLGVRLGGTLDSPSTWLIFVFGCVLFLIALFAVVTKGLRRDSVSGSPLGVALIVFGLLYAIAFADARAWAGPVAASASQYTTFTLLIVVGCYLALVGDWAPPVPNSRLRGATRPIGAALIGIICVQVGFGAVNGTRTAAQVHNWQTASAVATAEAREVSDPVLVADVGGIGVDPQVLRSDIGVLSSHHLAFFADPALLKGYRIDAARAARSGGFGTPSGPLVRVVAPFAGQEVHGRLLVGAAVQPGVSAASLRFDLIGPGPTKFLVGPAGNTQYGWLAKWATTHVPNGSYQMTCTVVDSRGRRIVSAPVAFRVQNP